jgi:3-deoxy-D-manno-octulosonic-acid transferase
VVWIHVTGVERRSPLMRLGQRLAELRPGLTLLYTAAPGVPPPPRLRGTSVWQPLPAEGGADSERFMRHWVPDCCLWSGGAPRAALLRAASAAGVPLYLVDAAEKDLETGRLSWLPAFGGDGFDRFDAALARDEAAARRLRRLGVQPTLISVIGPLLEGSGPLPCDDTDFDTLSELLATRPVWLAAMTQPAEVSLVLQAHRATLRLAHRLLLILVPDSPADGDAAAADIASAGLLSARRSAGEAPDDSTQVFLADTRGEMGLWYRLAPVTFMASSLEPGHGGRDPYEAAALGSAVLYGPNVGHHLDAYSRLANGAAARMAGDGAGLSAALAQLIAPDRAAAMAEAGWQIVSAGAEVTDRITDLVLDTLDLGKPA